MVAQIPPSEPGKVQPKPIEYPDCDGQPMADNTKQFHWIPTRSLPRALSDRPSNHHQRSQPSGLWPISPLQHHPYSSPETS